MVRATLGSAVAAAAILGFGICAQPTPAAAQFGIDVRSIAGGAISHALRHGNRHYSQPRSSGRKEGRRGRDRDDDSGKAEKPGKATPSNTLLARVSTDAVFKSMIVSKGLGKVGVEEEIDSSRNDRARDNQRDYTGAIGDLLKIIDDAAKQNSRDGNAALSQGDVTQHALDRAVAKSFEGARLTLFEQFIGEQWTSERLRVAILERARTEVPDLLIGNNYKRVEFAPIDDIIQRAGRSIFKRTFETSELIAVNQATARFTRALFEMRGSLASDDIRENLEDMLLAASRAALADYDERFVRSEFGIVLRYRAGRILLDCLTGNIEEIAPAKTDADPKARMVDKVVELSRGECRRWVVNAIGEPAQAAQGDDGTLKPLPIRAVWISPGVPKTDASMFGRANSNL